jgi:superfamily II DNA or RNA helicase
MWSMLSSCVEQFEMAELAHGAIVFEAERVQAARWRDKLAGITVEGAGDKVYQVNLDFSHARHGRLPVWCSCSRFNKGRLCSHLWAALLQLDDAPQIRGLVPRTGSLQIERDARLSLRGPQLATAAPDQAQKSSVRQRQPEWAKSWANFNRQVRSMVDRSHTTQFGEPMTPGVQYWFSMSLDEQLEYASPRLHLYRSSRLQDGRWGKPVKHAMTVDAAPLVADPHERKILALCGAMADASEDRELNYSYGWSSRGRSVFELTSELCDETLTLLSETGRFGWVLTAEHYLDGLQPLKFDAGAEWHLCLSVLRIPDSSSAASDAPPLYEIAHSLRRADQVASLEQIVATFESGLVVFRETIARLRATDVPLIRVLMQSPLSMQFPREDLDLFMSRFSELPNAPELELDPGLQVVTEAGRPRGKLVIGQPVRSAQSSLYCDLRFAYGEAEVAARDGRNWLWEPSGAKMVQRDRVAELELVREFFEHPVEQVRYPDPEVPGDWRISAKALTTLTTDLCGRGWEVMADGRRLRTAANFHVEVQSGIDWFNLHGSVDFNGLTASLPALLHAVRKRQSFVVLDDGSKGILPDDWLKRYAGLADLVSADGKQVDDDGRETMRVPRSQALLLEVLLAQHDQLTVDTDYRQLCDRLRDFQGITPQKEPSGFQGELRPYQRDGLGWFAFLREFGFGGCLADDMGLGKTVQVLAMLETRRARRMKKGETRRPTLVVVPKSLIFNWIDEAARFTPKLRVANYTGLGRKEILAAETDVLVTTYGTLRQDIALLKDLSFDYVILDEAQAIKNPQSQAAQCCRLLQATHRLAMSGTPVENHLGELWSLFDFLNPGMIASPAVLRRFQDADPDSEFSLQTLAKTLRPFMLRRTKEQVLTELPEKTEQTLFCEMTTKQRQLYDELREHYRLHLSNKIKELGLKRAKIHVLEALLRLRQAACDPRLLDQKQKVMGAKLEALFEQIESVIAEGHKALIFSQFTSLLALVRKELDARKITYEYLDGQTNDRAERVRRFQSDPACPLFLISLKAGGHGLNLTAADYVLVLCHS